MSDKTKWIDVAHGILFNEVSGKNICLVVVLHAAISILIIWISRRSCRTRVRFARDLFLIEPFGFRESPKTQKAVVGPKVEPRRLLRCRFQTKTLVESQVSRTHSTSNTSL